MIGLLLTTVLSETDYDVRSLISGEWSVTSTDLTDMSSKTFTMNGIKVGVNELRFDVEGRMFKAIFTGRGIFTLFEGSKDIALFDFSTLIPPKISSYGRWNTSDLYSATLVSNQVHILHVFSPDNHKATRYEFSREDKYESEETEQPLYKYGFVAVTFGLAMGLFTYIKHKGQRFEEESEPNPKQKED